MSDDLLRRLNESQRLEAEAYSLYEGMIKQVDDLRKQLAAEKDRAETWKTMAHRLSEVNLQNPCMCDTHPGYVCASHKTIAAYNALKDGK